MTALEPPGDTGPRFANLAAQAFEAIHHKLAPHKAKVRDEAISAWLEGHEADAVALARQVIADVAQHPDLPKEAKPIFDLMLRPEHQTQAILTVLGIYPIVSAFVMAAVQPFAQDVANLAWSDHPSLPLPPAELALGILRANPHLPDPAKEIAKSGYSEQILEALVYNTGEPPGLMQLLEAYRRGYIDVDRLKTGVRQSRVRDEWFQTVLDLRYAPPSPAEAIMAAVKHHLDDDTAKKLVGEAGLNPDHYDWLRATAGRPPGAMEMLQLVNRGLMDEATFASGIAQSDIQDRWCAYLFELRRYIPPTRSIVSMIRHSAVSDDYAKVLLSYHGVTPEDQAIYLAEGHAQKITAEKELSLGVVKSLYSDGITTKDEAHQAIVALGYNDAHAEQIIELEDTKVVQRYRNAAVGHVHTLFVHHKITQPDASAKLDALQIRHAVRDQLISVWIIEREVNIATLSLAQAQGAWRRGVIDDQEFGNRVRALGHPDSDIPILKALAFPPSAFHGGPTPADI